MNLPAIEALDRQIETAVAEARATARRLIEGRIGDAFAHATAANGLTSFTPAQAKASLMNLRRELLDLSKDVRGAQYRRSWAFYKDFVPAEFHSEHTDPPLIGIEQTREHPLYDRPLELEIGDALDAAVLALQTALNVASIRRDSSSARRILLGWRDRSIVQVARKLDAILSDSVIVADRIAGRHVIHPDFHEQEVA